MVQLLAFASISWAWLPFAAAAGTYCSQAPYASLTSYGAHPSVQSFCSASFSPTPVTKSTIVSATTTDTSTETSTAPTATLTSTSTTTATTTIFEPHQPRKRYAEPESAPQNGPPKECTPGRVAEAHAQSSAVQIDLVESMQRRKSPASMNASSSATAIPSVPMPIIIGTTNLALSRLLRNLPDRTRISTAQFVEAIRTPR
ncbi:hypothetical protein BST61_g5683 [Cercospora zeina]